MSIPVVRNRRWFILSGVVVLLLVLVSVLVLHQQSALPASWHIYSSVHSMAPNEAVYFHRIGGTSSSDLWAVGAVTDTFFGRPKAASLSPQDFSWNLIQHWDGVQWNRLPTPLLKGMLGFSGFSDVLALSPTNVWVVGNPGLVGHFNGSTWQQIAAPCPSFYAGGCNFNGIAGASATDMWLAGSYDTVDAKGNETLHPLLEHWNGMTWQQSPSAPLDCPATTKGWLSGIAWLDAQNVIAVGGCGSDQLSEQWDGSSWKQLTSPPLHNSYLQRIVAVNSREIWGVGDTINDQYHPVKSLIEHWDGQQWSVVGHPQNGADELSDLATINSTDIWAVGTTHLSDASTHTLLEHWDGHAWQIISSPNVNERDNSLSGVAVTNKENLHTLWLVGEGNVILADDIP